VDVHPENVVSGARRGLHAQSARAVPASPDELPLTFEDPVRVVEDLAFSFQDLSGLAGGSLGLALQEHVLEPGHEAVVRVTAGLWGR